MCLYESITERFCLVQSCEHATMDQFVLSHKSHLIGVQYLLGNVVDMGRHNRHCKMDMFDL
jgi:hypothetical protein